MSVPDVQAKLAERAVQRSRSRSPSILAGLIFDDRGNLMSPPSHANKKSVRYRYYVSQALLQSRKTEAGSIARFLSAPDVEALVCRALREVLRTYQQTAQTGNDIPGRRADIVALATDATIHIVEIKSSVADFRADTEWRDYRAHCDRLFFAIPETVPIEIMPQDAGLILADSNGAEILREAPERRMAAATRR